MDTSIETPKEPLDERRFAEESSSRKRELDLREREVAAKEKDLKRSGWLNPVTLGIFAAAVGLIGNVVVAVVNNHNLQQVERGHSQSNLILEAIKTGSSDAACKNLIFFVDLRLLDDPKQTIRHTCHAAPAGGPYLPSSPSMESSEVRGLEGVVRDSDTERPIWGATVSAVNSGQTVTTESGQFKIQIPGTSPWADVQVSKRGYETMTWHVLLGSPVMLELHKER
jgi:hypothetical protein